MKNCLKFHQKKIFGTEEKLFLKDAKPYHLSKTFWFGTRKITPFTLPPYIADRTKLNALVIKSK